MYSHCIPDLSKLQFSIVIYSNQGRRHFINRLVKATEGMIYNLTLATEFLAAITLSAEAVYCDCCEEK